MMWWFYWLVLFGLVFYVIFVGVIVFGLWGVFVFEIVIGWMMVILFVVVWWFVLCVGFKCV